MQTADLLQTVEDSTVRFRRPLDDSARPINLLTYVLNARKQNSN